MRLTEEQRQAAESDAASLVVSAGPGSGKTRVVAARVLHWLRSGVPASSILAICFTRAAAATLAARIVAELPGREPPLVSTIHALASARVLPAGYGVATEDQAETTLRGLYEGKERRPARDLPGVETLEAEIARHEAGLPPADAVADRALRLLLFRLDEQRLWPLWSLVPRALAGLRKTGGRFARVALDEHQDVTPNEGAFARELAGDWFTALGDPGQAIFEWKHGYGLERLAEDTRAALTRTFRFGPAIAAQVNRIGVRFGAAPVEPAELEGEAGRLPWSELGQEVAADPGRTLVLARTNHECEQIVRALGRIAEHVVRTPDPLGALADRFAACWARGRATVATIHSSKGLECDRVVVVMDLESEPKDQEEERIRYVACSRARRRLVVIEPTEEITRWRT